MKSGLGAIFFRGKRTVRALFRVRAILLLVMGEPLALATGACSSCGQADAVLDPQLLAHMALRVCVSCRQEDALGGGARFSLVAKSRARAEFALPESFFRGLPFVPRPNPRHERFAPLKLYLRATLEREAMRLHGSLEALEREKQARNARAYAKAAQRSRALLKRRLPGVESGEGGNESNDCRRKTTSSKSSKSGGAAAEMRREADHRHEFGGERFDEQARSWTKRCACGVQVSFEKL